MTWAGRERTYRIHLPPQVTPTTSLVVMLHGGLGSAADAQAAYGWDQVADAHGVIVVYPEGVGRTWNAGGGCCGPAATQAIDDVSFVAALTGELQRQYAVVPARTFLAGFSNGGMLAYAIACQTDSRQLFAAIGVVAATSLGPCADPAPVSLLHIHGEADASVRPDGQPGSGRGSIDGPALDDLIAFWRTVDHCAAPVVSTTGVVTTSLATCAEGRRVEVLTIKGAGHQWPGSAPSRAAADPPSTAINATATLWTFFASTV